MDKRQEFLDRCTHFYLQTDGTYKWPNSCEGDLLKMAHKKFTEQLEEKMASIFNIYMLGTWPEDNYADSVVGEAGTKAAAQDRLKIIAKEHYNLPEDQFYIKEEEL